MDPKNNPTAPPNPFKDSPTKASEPPPGFKEDAYDLEEGRAVVRWPDRLTAESVKEMEDWFNLIIRKMKRMTGVKFVPTNPREAAQNEHPVIPGPNGPVAVIPVTSD